MRHGPFDAEDIGIDPHMMHMMVRELDHLLESEPEPKPEVEVSGSASPAKARRKKRPKLP